MSFTREQLNYYRQAFQQQTLLTTPAVVGILDLYGMEVLEWLPETLRLEVQDDFNVPLVDPLLSRILTGFSLLIEDDFYKSLPDFIMHCNIMSGDSFNPELWDPADSGECAWGITEALLLAPPEENDDAPFSSDIVAYIGAVLDAEGIVTPPDVLRIATRVKPAYDVGNYADDPDMFSAIWSFEHSKTDDINQMLQGGLKLMMQQLESLPLVHGNAADIMQRMQKVFNVST